MSHTKLTESSLIMKKPALILLFISLLPIHNISANENDVYEVYGRYEEYNCTIDLTYKMGQGGTSEKRGGRLVITITNENVEIVSSRSRDSVASGNLRLVARSEVEIIAINETMQFSYQVKSHKFSFTTGNGKSGFKSGVGHVGKQVMTQGTCT